MRRRHATDDRSRVEAGAAKVTFDGHGCYPYDQGGFGSGVSGCLLRGRRAGCATLEQRVAPTGAERESAGRTVLGLRRAPERARRVRLEDVQKLVGERSTTKHDEAGRSRT